MLMKLIQFQDLFHTKKFVQSRTNDIVEKGEGNYAVPLVYMFVSSDLVALHILEKQSVLKLTPKL